MGTPDAVAWEILDMLARGSMFQVLREGETHVIVWSANAHEQIAEAIRRGMDRGTDGYEHGDQGKGSHG